MVRTFPQQPVSSASSVETARFLVCYHKSGEMITSDYLCPIQAGRAVSNVVLSELIGDDTGDNISARNKQFCELTAIYWAWKNVDADAYGLMHYRRVFDFTARFPAKQCYSLDDSIRNDLGLTDDSIRASLKGCDAVLPRKSNVRDVMDSDSVWNHYAKMHHGHDLPVLRRVIQKVAPQTLPDFDDVFAADEAYFFNMHVMRKTLFHDYAKWLFQVLFELEPLIDVSSRDAYQQRALAFMGERLLSVYIHHRQRVDGIRIKELPVVFVADCRPGFAETFRTARRRFVRVRVKRTGMHLKLLGWEIRRGSERKIA